MDWVQSILNEAFAGLPPPEQTEDDGGINGSTTSTPQVPSTWMANSDKWIDPDFRIPLPYSPNDVALGPGWFYQDDGNLTQGKYDSYWLDGPPPPPPNWSPEMSAWDMLTQGALFDNIEQPPPPPQYPPRAEDTDEPYMKNWDYMMGNSVWDNLQPREELPTLPWGGSW